MNEGPKTEVRVEVKVRESAKGKMGTKSHARAPGGGECIYITALNSFPWWQYARFGLACLVEWEGSQGTGLPAARKPWLPVQHREGWDRVSPNIHLSLDMSPQPATWFHVQQTHQLHLHIQKRSIHLHPPQTPSQQKLFHLPNRYPIANPQAKDGLRA